MPRLRARLCCAVAAIATIAMPAPSVIAAKPAPVAATPAPNAAPRNVIFILLDDLRYDGMGFLQPTIHTPNIDKLARGGTYFPNTYVTSSLCSPSRATILTGETARNHGVVDNIGSSEKNLVFFPSYLQKAGYQTAFIGKWHMGKDEDSPRPGFDKWVSFRGQGHYWPSPKPGVTMINVDGKRVPQKGYITDELTDYAMDWLEKERDPKKPFFLYLSHKAVHADPLPPPRYEHQYDNTKFAIPASAANTPENNAGKPMWVYNQRNSWHGIDFFYLQDRKMADYLKDYYATLSAVDDSVGRILDYLKKNHLEKNTLIVFTSDNGLQIGDHGLIDKRTAYEASVRVPMIMYEPGTIPAGVTNPGRLRNLDYAPTFLDMAGVARPAQFEGISAWPLVTGQMPASAWKAPDFTYEYFWEQQFPMTPTTFALRHGDFKYIRYWGIYDRNELYDVAKDPEEMHNLIDDPAYRSTAIEMEEQLYQNLANRDDKHMIPFGKWHGTGVVQRRIGGTDSAPMPKEWQIEPRSPKDVEHN
jgi:arylsulfatase A-like enzyme